MYYYLNTDSTHILFQEAKERTEDVILVGISYDRTEKKHCCVIEVE